MPTPAPTKRQSGSSRLAHDGCGFKTDCVLTVWQRMQSRHRPCARLCKGATRSNRMRVPIVVIACVFIARPIAQPVDEDSEFPD